MSTTLEKDLDIVRASIFKLREERLKLQQLPSLSKEQEKALEEIRLNINRHRKRERFVKNQIAQLRQR